MDGPLGKSIGKKSPCNLNFRIFFSGTRNLHAWDVPLKKVTFKSLQMKFPNLAENAMKRANFHPTKRGLEMGITAKIFIGMEYECPRGHRFISGIPNNQLQNSMISL